MKKKNRARSNTSLEVTPAPAVVVAPLPMPALVKPAQAAAILGVSLGTLAHWRSSSDRKRELRFVKVGSPVRYHHSDLDAFMATRG